MVQYLHVKPNRSASHLGANTSHPYNSKCCTMDVDRSDFMRRVFKIRNC